MFLATVLGMRGLKPCLLTPHPLVQIREEGASGDAEVVTASGEVLRCDAVVITVPLGVLKVGDISLNEFRAACMDVLRCDAVVISVPLGVLEVHSGSWLLCARIVRALPAAFCMRQGVPITHL